MNKKERAEFEDLKNTMNQITRSNDENERRINKLTEEIRLLTRTLERHRDGEVIYIQSFDKFFSYSFVRFYINRKEYTISDLRLHNPIFTYKGNDNFLYISDSYKDKTCDNKEITVNKKYIVNLKEQRFEETENDWCIKK